MKFSLSKLYVLPALFSAAAVAAVAVTLRGGAPAVSAAGIAMVCAAAIAASVLMIRKIRKEYRGSIEAVRALCGKIASDETGVSVPAAHDYEMGRLAASVEGLGRIMEERLEKGHLREDEIRNSLNNLGDAVIILDSAKKVLLSNKAARAVFQIQDRDYTGEPFINMVLNKAVNDVVDAAMTDGAPREAGIETDIFTKSAIDLRVFPYNDEYSGERHAVITARDVSRLKKLETVRTEFIENASHELRTPVALIRGFVETLLGAKADPAAQERFLDLLDRESKRLARLTEDILVLEKSEKTAVEQEEIGEIDAAKELAGYARTFAHAAKEKGLSFETDLPGEPVIIRMPAGDFGQIFTNLLDNAIKFTDGGGIVLRMKAEGGGVAVTVEDTGIGIPPNEIQRVFERFYRVDKARSRDTGGTGLGLSIVKHLVEKRGGTIQVTSRPGAGTRFDVNFTI